MDDDRVTRLSARQLDCLRLLPIMGSSKGIAEALQITPGTVDQHLKAARRMLGVSDSWAASRLMLAHQERHPQKLDTQPEPVAAPVGVEATGFGTNDRSEGRGEREATGSGRQNELLSPRRIMSLSAMLFPPVGRPPNDLSARFRLSMMAVQALLATGAVSMLFALVCLMSRLLIVLARHGAARRPR